MSRTQLQIVLSKTALLVSVFFASLVVVLGSGNLIAQEIPQSKPVKEHEWLKQFAGKWETETKSIATDQQPAMTGSGTIDSQMMGDHWVINTMIAKFGGFEIKGQQTIGFDQESGKYVGTWIDSSSDYMWHYKGSVDETGKILTLEAEGPDMTRPGETALFQDIYHFVSRDEVHLKSQAQGEDGQWVVFMTGVSKRAK